MQVEGPWPNPVTSAGGEFRIYLMSDLEVVAKLYDARGSLIESTSLGLLQSTGPQDSPDTVPHAWKWPDTSSSGRLPSGIYWLEFGASGYKVTRKLTLIH